MDEVVPSLMVALERSGDEIKQTRALNGLIGILSMRSRELLPYIIPKLIESPISLSHSKALLGISTVTGGTLHYHFSSIIPAILNDLAKVSTGDDDARSEGLRECTRVLFANTDDVGVNKLFNEISSKCGNDKPQIRRESCWMFEAAVTERKYHLLSVLGWKCFLRDDKKLFPYRDFLIPCEGFYNEISV
jgi:hypothetical protein